MPDYPSWRLLPAAAPGIPNLLVAAVFTAESYKVHVTDLANLWTESIDRRPIIKRGLVEDTSIDPSDGPDQLQRMLELVRAAFDTDDPEHANTSLTISNDKDDSLLIHVTCILPKPLKPLKWPMHLVKCPNAALAAHLVLPLIQAHDARAREIGQLITALREKDGVINRLVDKLEATGTGLEHVFSALSGKRRVSRAAAEGKIKGLAPFCEDEFRRTAVEPQATASSVDVSSLLDGVFGATGLKYEPNMNLEASPILNDWWLNLGKGKYVVLVDRSKEKKAEVPPMPQAGREKSDGHDSDDDFQGQATPPGLASARKRGTSTRPNVVEGSDTSDGEEAEIPGSFTQPALSRTAKPLGSRLGALGGYKKSSPSPPRAKTRPRHTPAKGKDVRPSNNTDSETASDDDDDGNDQHGLKKSPPPPSPHKPPTRRGGLGRIGGETRDRKEAEPQNVRSSSPNIPKEADSPPRRHKLGVIGKSVTAEPSLQAESPSEGARGRSKTPTITPKESTRETSQDRADRKRAELQRDLERRAAAAPAKKKRKF